MHEILTPPNGGFESLLGRHEAAKMLSIGLRTLDQLLADGEIPVVRIGKTSVRFRPSALREFCEARETRLDPKRRAAIRGTSK
jgi:excisionase family DNA binding protein